MLKCVTSLLFRFYCIDIVNVSGRLERPLFESYRHTRSRRFYNRSRESAACVGQRCAGLVRGGRRSEPDSHRGQTDAEIQDTTLGIHKQTR